MVKRKVELDIQEQSIIRLILLSCEDMAIPEGGCITCPLIKKCIILQNKLMGRTVTNANNTVEL